MHNFFTHLSPAFTAFDRLMLTDFHAMLAQMAFHKTREQTATLQDGVVQPVRQQDFEAILADTQSTALEWLATARNYARYSNDGGKYDELTAYLKKIRRW